MEPDEVAKLAIIVEELVMNLYEHGRVRAQDVVTLEMSSTDEAVDLVLVDPGFPFDALAAPLSRETPARGGGAGLELIRAWASTTNYESGAGLNRLSLRLSRRT